jgi:metal-responsive CopG/Arc/MetJ family transcriptional regulator
MKSKPSEKRRIVVNLPASVLKDVEWLAPLEDMTRDELILAAVKRFLKPHLEIRKKILKAAASPSKLHVPFDTRKEFIASLHKGAKKLRAK